MDAITDEMMTLDLHSLSALSVCFSPDGNALACSTAVGLIGLWSVDTGKLTLEVARSTIPRAHLRALTWSADGVSIAAGLGDTRIHIWDARTGAEKQVLLRSAPPRALAWNPIQAHLVASCEAASRGKYTPVGSALILDIKEAVVRNTLDAGSWVHSFDSLAFSPSGSELVAGGVDGARLCLWDIREARPSWVVWAHRESIEAVAFSPDGTLIASGGDDGVVRLWWAQTGRLAIEMNGHTIEGRRFQPLINGVAFSPDGGVLASSGEDSTVRLWSTVDGSTLQVITLPGAGGPLAFSPDGTVLAVAIGEHPVQLWRITQ